MSDLNKIFIFDTTLRDGEQAPGASMNKEEKLRIASLLDRMHVDVIEAGFPVSSPDDFEAVRAIAGLAHYSIVAGLSRAVRADIDICAAALKPAKRKRIHTFISTSALHMEHKLRMTPDQVHAAVIDSVSYARNLCDDVEWGCEDGTRSDRDFLCRCIESAITAGARTVNIADTVGFTMPGEFVDLISNLMNRIPNIDKARLSVHCHDDLGLSVANSLAAISAGARQVECTINGIGERAGNAALEEIVMALDVRRDLLGCHTDVSTKYLSEISQLVSTITGFQVPPNKAIVGANAFAHESGIHQHGVMRHRGTYEIIKPSTVGVSQSTLVMGKHSGRHAFRMKLREIGRELSEDVFEEAFARFKAYAANNKIVSDEVIRAIAEETLTMEVPVAMELKAISVRTDSNGHQVACLSVVKDKKIETSEARGDKPFDAVVAAFQQVHSYPARIASYEVNFISNNGKGIAKATIELIDGARIVNGQAEDEDTVTAFAEAYISAINRIAYQETATRLENNGR